MTEKKSNLLFHTSTEDKKSSSQTAQSQGVEFTPSLISLNFVHSLSTDLVNQFSVIAAIVDKSDGTGIDWAKHC